MILGVRLQPSLKHFIYAIVSERVIPRITVLRIQLGRLGVGDHIDLWTEEKIVFLLGQQLGTVKADHRLDVHALLYLVIK